MLDVVSELTSLVQSVVTILGYIFSYLGYYLITLFDLLYKPFAGFFNAVCQLMDEFLDFFVLGLSWAGDTFMWLIGIMIGIYFFFFLIRLVVLLKEILLRWL